MLKESGIYKITNLIDKKIYIGSACYLKRRKRQHFSLLKNNIHYNKHLQNAWNKYGEKNFKFEIIEECDKEILLKREQCWLDFYKCYDQAIGYNLNPIAESNLGRHWDENTKKKISESLKGENNPFFGIPRSEEVKKKISIANSGENNGMYNKKKELHHFFGKHHTKESRKKMSDSHIGIQSGENHPRAKLTWAQVNEIREEYKLYKESNKKLGLNIRQLSDKFKICYSSISLILKNKSWIISE